MRITVKGFGHETVINIDENKTAGDLKTIVASIWCFPASMMKFSFSGQWMSCDEAKLRSLGIKEGSVLKVVFLPVVDFQSPIAFAIRNVLGSDCPTATVAAFIVHFKYILTRIVNEELSLDDLERYAEVRNKSVETSSLCSLDESTSCYSIDGGTMARATDDRTSRGEDLQDYFMYADD